VVSPKPPIYAINPKCRVDELKIVVTDDKVLEYIENTILSTDSFNVPVWLQPNGYDMAATARKAYEFILRHPNSQLKLGVQLHKIYDFK
jgi:hypothetical protein